MPGDPPAQGACSGVQPTGTERVSACYRGPLLGTECSHAFTGRV